MVPVFTAFHEDKQRNVNYDNIERYANLLKQKNVQGVMVNAASGEGLTLRTEERKRLAEEWLKVARKYQLTMVLNIGSTNVVEVYELAEHAEKIGVDAIVVLPDLFFRPRFEEDLVQYLRDVAQYAPTRPLFYYYIPELTGVRLSMIRLYDLIERELENFAGIVYAHHNLDEATVLLKKNRYVILWADTILEGALALGFEAITSTVLNVFPEIMVEVLNLHRDNKLREAIAAQDQLIKRIESIYRPGFDWIQIWKEEFNKVQDIKVGALRKPIVNVIRKEYWVGSM